MCAPAGICSNAKNHLCCLSEGELIRSPVGKPKVNSFLPSWTVNVTLASRPSLSLTARQTRVQLLHECAPAEPGGDRRLEQGSAEPPQEPPGRRRTVRRSRALQAPQRVPQKLPGQPTQGTSCVILGGLLRGKQQLIGVLQNKSLFPTLGEFPLSRTIFKRSVFSKIDSLRLHDSASSSAKTISTFHDWHRID